MAFRIATLVGMSAAIVAAASPARAEFDGPRVYWPLPKNTNIVSFSRFDGQSNLSFPLGQKYTGTLDVSPDLWVATYIRSQPILGRSTYWQLSLPFGSLDTDSSLPVASANDFADGLGDLTFGATINLMGAPALAVRDFLVWDERLSINAGFHYTAPTGTYDSDEALNMGSGRSSLRIAAPIVWNIGEWVPGRRTTLEVMPAVRFFGDNEDSIDQTIEQEPVYSLEAHFTRDLTRESFLSLDYTWLEGGEQTFSDNASGLEVASADGIDAQFLGVTFGFEVNDNLSMQIGHVQAIDGQVNGLDINAAVTRLQFVYSWHDVLERRSDF